MLRGLAAATVLMGMSSSAAALDIVGAYELALESDPVFRAATYKRLASNESLRIAWSQLFPKINAEATYTNARQDIKSSDNAFLDVDVSKFPTQTYRASLTQPLFRLTDIAGIMLARAETRQAAAELDAELQDLLLRVADAYLAVLAARDELALRDAERAALERQSVLAERRLAAGLGIASDRYEAEARLALAEADGVVANFALRDAYEALAEITGEMHEDLDPLIDDLPLLEPVPADPEIWVRNGIANNPGLQAQKFAVEAAKKEVSRQRSAHTPTLDFTASIDNTDSGGSPLGGGSQVEVSEYAVKITVPIFSGGSVLFATRRATDLQHRERELYTQAQRSVIRETRAAFRAVGSLVRRVRALHKTAEVQQLAVKSREKAVRSGVDTAINILNAERELYEAKRDLAAGRYQYVRSVLKLEQVAGALGIEDLRQVNQWLGEP